MRMGPISASAVRSAKLHAIGGARKRCKMGKNCSATCIDRGKWCLVDLPTPASTATTKVRDFLKGRTILRSGSTGTAPNNMRFDGRLQEAEKRAQLQKKGETYGKAVAQGVAEKGRG